MKLSITATTRSVLQMFLLAATVVPTVAQAVKESGPPSFTPAVAIQRQSYIRARHSFHSMLLRQTPAPQTFEPMTPPAGVSEVEYLSGELRLKAWVNRPTMSDHGLYPAVLFLHGGYAFDLEDWQVSQPFHDAGFVVMAPMLRGENGQPGTFSLFYDEVDDVVAAAEYLRHQPFVDPDQLYVAGPSVGGTMTMLAAMSYKHFRAAASFSGSPDQVLYVKYAPGAKERAPFDTTNQRELEMRSPLAFAGSFLCPLRIYYGAEEPHFYLTSQRTAEIARAHKVDVQAVKVDGNHMSEVPQAIKLAIRFFQQVGHHE